MAGRVFATRIPGSQELVRLVGLDFFLHYLDSSLIVDQSLLGVCLFEELGAFEVSVEVSRIKLDHSPEMSESLLNVVRIVPLLSFNLG